MCKDNIVGRSHCKFTSSKPQARLSDRKHFLFLIKNLPWPFDWEGEHNDMNVPTSKHIVQRLVEHLSLGKMLVHHLYERGRPIKLMLHQLKN